MAKNKQNGVALSLRVAPEMEESVKKIAYAEGKSKSEVYRELLEKGLVAGGYKAGTEDMTARIREAVEAVMRPQVERLASISAKAAQISAADFFLLAWLGQQLTPPGRQADYEEIANAARRLGVQYLKLGKDKDIDQFLADGRKKLGET